MPTVISMGGDGATYDIASRAVARAQHLDADQGRRAQYGAYSNTGGQASTASLTAQDSDLSRYGGAHHGKQTNARSSRSSPPSTPTSTWCRAPRRCRGISSSTWSSSQPQRSPAVLDVYTPCQGEQGIADPEPAGMRALGDHRMNPVFVHDPRRGASLHERFSLEGNPTRQGLGDRHDRARGERRDQAARNPMTPADFALTEGRFRKHFHRLKPDAVGVPVVEYIDLSPPIGRARRRSSGRRTTARR